MGNIIKKCGCGHSYTLQGWRRLDLRGYMGDSDYGMEMMELRNCACGSTLAVLVDDLCIASAVELEGGEETSLAFELPR